MAEYFTKGIVLEQNKEPALSQGVKTLLTGEVQTIEKRDRLRGTRTGDQVIQLARLGKVINETDGSLLYEELELARKKGIKTLVVDAIDDEPYISSQLAPALHLTGEFLRGLELIQKAIGSPKVSIAVYREMDSKLPIPKEMGGVPVERIGGSYPAEYRSKSLRKMPGKLVVGSCALIHLARAAENDRVQNTCFLTVAGDSVENPCNLEVTVGTSLQQVLEHCGLRAQPRRVVVGGSMTGFAVTDTVGTLVTPMTRGILAFQEDFKKMNYTCIGCGRCAGVCPEGLSPYYIYKFITSRRYGELERFDIESCTGCGTCSYVCPAKLDISAVIATGKRALLARRSREPAPIPEPSAPAAEPSAPGMEPSTPGAAPSATPAELPPTPAAESPAQPTTVEEPTTPGEIPTQNQ